MHMDIHNTLYIYNTPNTTSMVLAQKGRLDMSSRYLQLDSDKVTTATFTYFLFRSATFLFRSAFVCLFVVLASGMEKLAPIPDPVLHARSA